MKICGVTEVEDALVAAGLGANAVGMIFAASSRRITSGVAPEITRRLPAEVMPVGVFLDENPKRVLEIANTVGFSAVQIHGRGAPEETRWLAERLPTVIRAFSATDPALENAADYGATRLLIDSATPGSGQPFDWAVLESAPLNKDFILAGGLNPENVGEAIRSARPWGVDVASGVESSPGRKDAAKLRRFMKAVRSSVATPGQSQHGFGDRGEAAYPDDDDGSIPFNWEEDSTWR